LYVSKLTIKISPAANSAAGVTLTESPVVVLLVTLITVKSVSELTVKVAVGICGAEPVKSGLGL